jgi:single-strand DNA-binding protein
MINKVVLIGHLGKDPEVRTLESGATYAKFSVATSEAYKDKTGEWQNVTEWHNIILWRELAERSERQLRKGSLVYIEGKLTSRSYQDQEGNTKYITEVRGNTFRSLDKKESSNTSNTGQATSMASNPAPKTAITNDDAADDLPF